MRRRHGGELITALTGASDELRPVVLAEPAVRPGYLLAPCERVGTLGAAASEARVAARDPAGLSRVARGAQRVQGASGSGGADAGGGLAGAPAGDVYHVRGVGEGDLDAVRGMVARRVVPAYG